MAFHHIIDCTDAAKLLAENSARFIDCRFDLADTDMGKKQFEHTHVPGALYAHLDNDLSGEIIKGVTGRHPLPEKDEFESLVRNWGINQNDQIIIYDQWHGGIAARLWWLFKHFGHENVAVLNGGWRKWIELDLPVNNEKNLHMTSSWKAKKSQNDFINATEIFTSLSEDHSHKLLIDARTTPRYEGKEEPIDPIAGHIPGAINLPFLENLNEDGLWKSTLDIRARFLSVIEPADEIAFYCGSGVTACHNILALNYAGLKSAKLYPGSWSDWITHVDYPIETNL